MSFLSHLEWRHATKVFDAAHALPADKLTKILHAIRMAPTSFGLQPFYVEVIEDRALREALLPHAWNQPQIITSQAVLVFVVKTDLKARIDQLLSEMTGGNADARAGLKVYEGMMRGALEGLAPDVAKAWSAKQAYIAMGFGMAACAELEIDSCPMEGFSSPEFDKILKLPAGHFSAALLPVGYRDPAVPPRPKFRFSEADLIKRR